MLTLFADGAESLWDELLPEEVRVLPDDLRATGRAFRPIRSCWCRSRSGGSGSSRWPGKFVRSAGDRSLAMETYVRLMVLKHRYGWGYETLMREVSDSIHLRRFCRIGLTERVPDESTVRKLTRRLGAEVVHEITRELIGKAQAGEAVQASRGADRLDRGRGRREVSDRLGAGGRWRQDAGSRGPQAGGAGRREPHRGQGSLAGDGAQAARR